MNLESEIGSIKKSLDDVPSLAVLKNDPRGELPSSFTICSDTMSVFSTKENRLMFFNLIGSNEDQLLAAVMIGDIFFTTRAASGQIPTVFPNQWVRSCMAIDTVSGMIQWVVEGELVENNTIVVMKDYERPNNLKGKIILGAYQMPTKSWWVFSKNGHILPKGQWYAPSAVINDALIMPEYVRACQGIPEYARLCQSMQEYAKVCQCVPE